MSQSPTNGTVTREYSNAWASLRTLIIEENASLSGRERNNVFLNVGDGTFADVSAISHGDAIGDGRALATTDWDDDGRIDLVLRNRTAPRLQIFHNRNVSDAHFLALELEGVSCNRDAIGARVIVEAGGRTLRRTLRAGDGFLSQSSKRLHFGLGSAERIDRVTVLWPDGRTDAFADLRADERYAIRQGEAEARTIPARSGALAGREPSPVERDPRGVVRLALIEKLPMAVIAAPSFDEPLRTVGDLAGGAVLLNLWSATCASCLKELSELSERSAEIERAGLRFVPLAVDPPEEHERGRTILERYGLADDAGPADEGLLAVLRLLLGSVVGSQRETPLPTSLLLDSHGQLAAVYLGRVDVDELLVDLDVLSRMDPTDLLDTRLVPGRKLAPRRRNLGLLARQLEEIDRPDLTRFYRRAARARD